MFVARGVGILAPQVNVITTAVAGSITTPSGYSKVTVEAIGAGGRGYNGGNVEFIDAGGGGGWYAISNANIAVTGGTTIVYYSVGASTVQSWVNVGTNAAPSASTAGCLAKSGGTADSDSPGNYGVHINNGSIGATTRMGGQGSSWSSGSAPGGGGAAATTAASGQTAGTDTTGLSPSTLMGSGTGGSPSAVGTAPGGGGGGGGGSDKAGGIGRVRIVFYQ